MTMVNNFGIKKLGRSVIDVSIPQVTEPPSGQFYQRISVGSGIDDRASTGATELEVNYITLSRISKAFQQKNLLMALESPSRGELYKLERIHLAASLDSTLPCTSTFTDMGSVVRPSMLSAGGLMKEWEDLL